MRYNINSRFAYLLTYLHMMMIAIGFIQLRYVSFLVKLVFTFLLLPGGIEVVTMKVSSGQ